MTRAERRRMEKEAERKKKTFVMTAEELDKIRLQEREKARQEFKAKTNNVALDIFKMMLIIPTNILVTEYWEKTARKRIPKFVDECLSIYEAWQQGAVDFEQMRSLAEEYSKIKFVEEGTSTANVIERRQKRGTI